MKTYAVTYDVPHTIIALLYLCIVDTALYNTVIISYTFCNFPDLPINRNTGVKISLNPVILFYVREILETDEQLYPVCLRNRSAKFFLESELSCKICLFMCKMSECITWTDEAHEYCDDCRESIRTKKTCLKFRTKVSMTI